MSTNISLSSSASPETRLPDETVEVQHLVSQVAAARAAGDRELVASLAERLVRAAPRSSLTWWVCGLAADTDVARYAAYRVGYHRGLDSLRANGWKGSGYVRWNHVPNRGFLRCLHGLQQMAGQLGELDEEERCRLFLLQLDPAGVPASEIIP